jgi:hypothetical protein
MALWRERSAQLVSNACNAAVSVKLLRHIHWCAQRLLDVHFMYVLYSLDGAATSNRPFREPASIQ